MGELTVSQQLTVAALRQAGWSDPEAIVAADPVGASIVGNRLRPALEDAVALLQRLASDNSNG